MPGGGAHARYARNANYYCVRENGPYLKNSPRPQHPLLAFCVFCTSRKHTMRPTRLISAVPQTAENNLSGSPGEIHHPCPNYQGWLTAPLLLKDNQRASVGQFHPAHHTFYRADPSEGCRLCEDTSSGWPPDRENREFNIRE
ncbi:hypothetical protein J6590_079754 [Homalodisca vitripennis]|nr:hypothetical protein J6590_079754 [Homalodisca vitripennis]